MKISVNADAWKANANIDAVMPFPRDGAPMQYRFMLPGRTDVVTANVVDDGQNIEVYPDRSSAHRTLVSILVPDNG